MKEMKGSTEWIEEATEGRKIRYEPWVKQMQETLLQVIQKKEYRLSLCYRIMFAEKINLKIFVVSEVGLSAVSGGRMPESSNHAEAM